MKVKRVECKPFHAVIELRVILHTFERVNRYQECDLSHRPCDSHELSCANRQTDVRANRCIRAAILATKGALRAKTGSSSHSLIQPAEGEVKLVEKHSAEQMTGRSISGAKSRLANRLWVTSIGRQSAPLSAPQCSLWLPTHTLGEQ